jgi:hypothetical protein
LVNAADVKPADKDVSVREKSTGSQAARNLPAEASLRAPGHAGVVSFAEGRDSCRIDAITFESTALDATPADASVEDRATSYAAILRQRFADLWATLIFHRANLYLGAAVVLVVAALMLPGVNSPRRAALNPMERALVALGIAEAPVPAVRLRGDPGLNVWVDPHTALYYCPGAEQYGKTVDGRFSSQHDAQMDRFQAAGRRPCD